MNINKLIKELSESYHATDVEISINGELYDFKLDPKTFNKRHIILINNNKSKVLK